MPRSRGRECKREGDGNACEDAHADHADKKINRLICPAPQQRTCQPESSTSATTMTAANSCAGRRQVRVSRKKLKTIISPTPTGIAAARHAPEISRAEVVINASSLA